MLPLPLPRCCSAWPKTRFSAATTSLTAKHRHNCPLASSSALHRAARRLSVQSSAPPRLHSQQSLQLCTAPNQPHPTAMHSATMAAAACSARLVAAAAASSSSGRGPPPAAAPGTAWRQRQQQRSVAAAAGPRSGGGRKGGKAAAPVQAPNADAAAEAAAAELAAERQAAADAAAALSEQQQQQMDALAQAISARLEALADSDDWTPGVRLGWGGCPGLRLLLPRVVLPAAAAGWAAGCSMLLMRSSRWGARNRLSIACQPASQPACLPACLPGRSFVTRAAPSCCSVLPATAPHTGWIQHLLAAVLPAYCLIGLPPMQASLPSPLTHRLLSCAASIALQTRC